jgi:hypothetical protein
VEWIDIATLLPGMRDANVKPKNSLEDYIRWWSFDSNICESASGTGDANVRIGPLDTPSQSRGADGVRGWLRRRAS